MRTMSSPWARFYSNSCCLCCHVRTGTIILGIWYLIINSVVLLILLSALTDPDQYHLPSADLGGEFEFMDDANMCIATAISLLMILICAMATYGAYKQHAAWIIPFFCYQIFDFALNTLVAISVLVYPNTIQDYLRQLLQSYRSEEGFQNVLKSAQKLAEELHTEAIFPPIQDYKRIFIKKYIYIISYFLYVITSTFSLQGYLISCVWNCYRYINSRNNSDVLVYIATNDTAVSMSLNVLFYHSSVLLTAS
ncbi:Lysosomal-associated transmembrane protein 4B [Chelonia mydas]|uniref:Lysosomal-associated transmembrane protein 4B n=1 Tax=Chelonia mydas TaxID=8469 RepID=M7BQ90_CHEMY|nr:Lysosomal-associated transmembrane protein 4B [Chelonia mydas]